METKSNAMPWRTHNKICTLSQLEENSSSAKAAGKKVVLCHGVFDLLHMGHVKHLQAARREGDLLIVTITADDFVNKGPGRPVFSQQLRAEMLHPWSALILLVSMMRRPLKASSTPSNLISMPRK